jgi:hypothetical protein
MGRHYKQQRSAAIRGIEERVQPLLKQRSALWHRTSHHEHYEADDYLGADRFVDGWNGPSSARTKAFALKSLILAT